MKASRALLLLAVVLCAGCFEDGSPTAPSEPRADVRINDVTFTATSVSLSRDFMPIVLVPGRDGGGALTGVIAVGAANRGSREARFSVAASVYDHAGTRHLATAVPRLAGRLAVWDGSIAPGQGLEFEVALSNGPYLAVGSLAFVVLQFTAQDGDDGTIRTEYVEITASY